MREAMNAGADKVAVCTAALEDPPLLTAMSRAFGSQCVVLSIDAKRAGGSWHAFSKGGRVDTGRDAAAWAEEAARLGAGEILLNSIDADGTGGGYDLALIRRVLEAVNVPVIASGGAGTLEQIVQALLPPGTEGGLWGNADAALIASILHFGNTAVSEIKQYARSKGVCVR
jgi:cyclase